MKKKIYSNIITGTTIIIVVLGYLWLKQETKYDTTSTNLTTIKTVKDSITIGTVKYGDKKNVVFQITNTGESPLIIKDVRPSCGCTNVEWNKHPIKPGETTEIAVVFEPNSLGRFIKSINVYCNTAEQMHQLKLLGQVEEK